jgi:hypothetical protein
MSFKLPGQRAMKQLVRVIPVAQTQSHGGVSITVTSLDWYAIFLNIHLYLWRDAVDGLIPRFHTSIFFDGERPPRGGGWGPAEVYPRHAENPHWYFVEHLTYPPPGPNVNAVQLVIPVVHLAREFDSGAYRLIQDVPGPWTFVATTAVARAAEVTNAHTVSQETIDPLWAEPSRVAELRARRRERTLPLYGEVYDDVLEAIYRYDPHAIGWRGDVPFGAEEYTPEADKIVPRLPQANSEDDVRRIVYEVIGDYYGARGVCGEECYAEMAAEMWRASQKS